MTTMRRVSTRIFGAALLASTAACSTFLEVDNPNVIDASTLDPANDAATFALSAQQNFLWRTVDDHVQLMVLRRSVSGRDVSDAQRVWAAVR